MFHYLLKRKNLCPWLNSFMFQPLSPPDFCQRWIPIKTGKQPQEYGYRKDSIKLLAELTGYGENTCDNWLSNPEKVPRLVKLYLRVVDILWQIQRLIPIPFNSIHK